MTTDSQQNWAGNYEYSAARWHRPKTVEQVQELVRHSVKLKAVGTRHSFNGIADTTGDMISLEKLESELVLDREHHKVTVSAGFKYGDLCSHLDLKNFGLHNLASLPHISVAGACATASHGSGDGNKNLATVVSGMEIVTADGKLCGVSRVQRGEQGDQEDPFYGMVVGFGGLGVVTKITLDLVPAYQMRQDVYENLAMSQLEKHFDDITSSGYSVSLFTDWHSESFSQVWLKRRVDDDASLELAPEWFGATPATGQRHPIEGFPADDCTQQMGFYGPWHRVLPHFRMEKTPSAGEELQSEYFVPRQHGVEAIAAVAQLREQIAPFLQISEIRTIAADALWMSPCYGQACVSIHFTWKQNWPEVKELLSRIENQLAPFKARPHWGKLFTMPPAKVQSFYKRLPDFQNLLRSYDPQGKFRNAFLDEYIFGT